MQDSSRLILALRDTAKNLHVRSPRLIFERLGDAADALAERDAAIAELRELLEFKRADIESLHAVAKDYQRERDAWLAWGKTHSDKGHDAAIRRDISARLGTADPTSEKPAP